MEIFLGFASLVTTFITLIMGSLVLVRNPRERLNQIFFLLCLTIVYIEFSLSQAREASSLDNVFFWFHFATFWPFLGSLLLHFSLVFSQRQALLRSNWSYVGMYGPPLALSIVGLKFYTGGTPILEDWGWSMGTDIAPLGYLSTLMILSYGAAAIIICTIFYARSSGRSRRQAGFVLAGLATPVVTSIVTEGFLRPIFAMELPDFSTMSFAIGVGGIIGLGMWKYELFELTPTTAANKILETMFDSLLLADQEDRVTSINRKAQEVLGRPQEEIIGNKLSTLFSGVNDQKVIRDILDDESVGGVSGIEMSFNTAAYGEVPVVCSFAKLRTDDNEFQGSVCVAHDISDIKTAREELKESETRYRALFETSPDGIMILDLQGKVTMCNPQVYQTHGFEREEQIVGHSGSEFMTPEGKQKMMIDLKNLVERPGPLGSGPIIEYDLACADGGYWPAAIKGSVLRDGAGRPQSFMLILRDITELKEAEEALHESEARYRKLINLSPDEIVLIDLEGHVLILNQQAAQLHGFDSIEEMKAINYIELVSPETRSRLENEMRQVVASGESISSEYELLRKDGSAFPAEVHATVIRQDDGEPWALLGVVRNISERKQVEAQLISQRREVGGEEFRAGGAFLHIPGRGTGAHHR